MTLPYFHAVNNRGTGTPRSSHGSHDAYEEHFFSIGTFTIPRANYTTVFPRTSSAGCIDSAFSAYGFSAVNRRVPIVHGVKGVVA